jgi:hypothetical protein
MISYHQPLPVDFSQYVMNLQNVSIEMPYFAGKNQQ